MNHKATLHHKSTLDNMHSLTVDTRRRLNLHKTFRRRPGRLLNVLCTFSLRPVSTGLTYIFEHCKYQKKHTIFT